ncbi:MFS transporter [Paenibacillus apiarius]|uniref:MFS transporter n=1 Tax=Paenibacillus apiarius TaxID=46240 RepID=UPI00300C9218
MFKKRSEIPVTAYFMNRFTTRQLFISSMLLLLVGSIVAASSPGFTLLLTGRLVQAAGAGIMMPLLMSVIYELFPVNKRGSAMGMIGLTIAFAPAIAPSLAGIVIEHVSWRWLFIGMIPLLAIVIQLSARYLTNVSETSKPKADILGIVYSIFGFVGILFGFSNASSSGWGNTVVLSCLIGGRVFGNRTYAMTAIINTLVTIIMYADLILLPLYLQTSRGYTPLESGLLLLPGALLMAIMSPITGRLFDKPGAKVLMLTGLVFVILAVWGITNHGSAVTNTVRQVAGAIGTALVVTVMTMSASHHAADLSQSGASCSQAHLAKESSILGTSDTFMYIFTVGIIAFVLTLFLPKRKSNSA